MRWEDERYIKIYVRDTGAWRSWPWQSRAVLPLLFRVADRTGLVEHGQNRTREVASLLGMPEDVTETGIAGLLEDGCVVENPAGLFIRNYLAAQDTHKSDAQRKRESRELASQQHLTESVRRSPPASEHVQTHPETSEPVTHNNAVPVPGPEKKQPCPTRRKSAGLDSREPDGFAAFWGIYPRHEAKREAVKAWRQIDPSAELLTTILEAIPRQRQRGCLEPVVSKDGRSLIPLPASWLRGRRWADEPPPRHEFRGNGATTASPRRLAAEAAIRVEQHPPRPIADAFAPPPENEKPPPGFARNLLDALQRDRAGDASGPEIGATDSAATGSAGHERKGVVR